MFECLISTSNWTCPQTSSLSPSVSLKLYLFAVFSGAWATSLGKSLTSSSSPHAIHSKSSPPTPAGHHQRHFFGICHLYFSPGVHTSSMTGPYVHPHPPSFSRDSTLGNSIIPWGKQYCGKPEEPVREQGGRAAAINSSKLQAPWAVEVTGGITLTGSCGCLGRTQDPGWLLWRIQGAPSREEREWLYLTYVRDLLTGSLENGHRLTPLPLGVGCIRMSSGSQQTC